MKREADYLNGGAENAVCAVVEAIDRDVERGEDMLMLGLCIVVMSTFFAPIAPPKVVLPLVALAFALSAGFALHNYHNMGRKLANSMARLDSQGKTLLRPIAAVFTDYPMPSLSDSFNPLKNLKRTWKSALGGILINPLWTPIFYMMGLQIDGEKNLGRLNRQICGVKQQIKPPPPRE